MKFWNLWWVRIVVDLAIILAGLVLVTVYRALSPRHFPNSITPESFNLSYQAATFPATDGLLLSGWLLYSPKAMTTIICCHGYPANKSDILPAVSFLYPDFNLLLFDFRGHGDSPGRLVTFGLRESKDILGAVNYLKKQPGLKNLPIGIWGYSLGGAVALKSCTLTEEISAIVTDSTYADFPEMVIQYYGNFGPFKYLLGILPEFLGNLFLKGGLACLSPENIVSLVKIPLLIIHSGNDSFVPVTHAQRLYQRANQPKELLILPGEGHGVGLTDEHQKKITAFFKKYLLGKILSEKPQTSPQSREGRR
ncbi:MAG: hypothetical protein COZ37_06140 [bacterium (Candidatus Ratteibacteria) CG_4_10_14_3_um_filter_41_18]|uniref:Peptidase S9 prolyl oligopeptidase catalytic domain-containing protein n=4 Tax=Candidatus Ratteibacteria TaxID=2979319 RepID=A0A2M7E8Y5_9BACT|nr:MAG: hypothetical protein AUJ76_01290 [Candidatus Omnitrophica bacterium CG1_02_41_171]PIV64151.1 MAG: hypothetical protein COS11_03685 [bacterium (Candidatus Ratteibacteria) CG01_land_8_20_14_3_00_40_19]PIW33666.1 MAG: hypothetical protein COW28_03370 [bacterium (Candidatus Ratteibacteria) CG15_BIG_FIL_POST_REV_8_21_14_020_41_12]PIW74125.1 MAG: hypothetical protein CO004_02365 [bacterium (Candidatus Ratteibacteria) CG_4_8_14_3_um_filter_41_36]PIX76776.1 MAG: hypothetical protein COZ37_06140